MAVEAGNEHGHDNDGDCKHRYEHLDYRPVVGRELDDLGDLRVSGGGDYASEDVPADDDRDEEQPAEASDSRGQPRRRAAHAACGGVCRQPAPNSRL